MHQSLYLLALLGSLHAAAGVELEHAEVARSLRAAVIADRAAADAPDGYAPSSENCPSNRPVIRSVTGISAEEKEWLPRRRAETIPEIKDFLKRAGIKDFDSDKYLNGATASSDSLPNIGIAVSGGGYRAMLNGAGAISAFDGRTKGSKDKGNLGGLLQSATYLSGLSGGGWLVGSIFANNFTTIDAAVSDKDIWQFSHNILEGPKDIGVVDYYTTIIGEVDKKHDAGFNRSITDYWGRMLSFQLVKARHGGPGVTFSSIANDTLFSSAKTPLPILVADSRNPGEKNTTLDNTLFEFNPWELASFDESLAGAVPLKYVGSKFDGGKIPDSEKCVRGFDNIGYVMGTSSSLFNQIILHIKSDPSRIPKDLPKVLVNTVIDVLTALGDKSDDVADWRPNPFKGFNPAKNKAADQESLTLVDGGEDGQNVPFHPHTVRERKVDVVFGVDTSADIHSWPNGHSASLTSQRSKNDNVTSFPDVPGTNTFINLGLNTKPTFFGCDASNMTKPGPLVVYLPNYPYIFNSNLSTFELTTNDSVRDAMISNGAAVVTQLNSKRDPEWPACVACAMLSRSFARTKTAVPAQCQQCFTRYCWNGTVDERDPATPYFPTMYSESVDVKKKNGAGQLTVGSGGLGSVVGVSAAVAAAVLMML